MTLELNDRDDSGARQQAIAEGVVDGLLRVAKSARFFRSIDGQVHAKVDVNDRLETFRLKSGGFRNWLIARFRSDRGEHPTEWALRRALWVIEAQAQFDDKTPAIH